MREGGGGTGRDGTGQTFVFMHMLTRLNGKGQWQIDSGRVESGSGLLGALKQALSQSENL